MTDEETLKQLLNDTLESSPTFSKEMIEKVRKELLKVGREAEEYYAKKAETE